MTKKTVPDRDAPMVDEQGRITPSWLEYFKDLDQRAFREKVSASAPANGDALVYTSATGLWTPTPN
jgi:hypothetical protein